MLAKREVFSRCKGSRCDVVISTAKLKLLAAVPKFISLGWINNGGESPHSALDKS
jgi:hypothetical protein